MDESEVGASDRKTVTLGFGSTPPRQHNDVGRCDDADAKYSY